MWVALIIAAVLVIILSEYRVKKPGLIVLYESKGKVRQRKSKFYPRHFSLVIPNKTRSVTTAVEGEAKGKIGAVIKVSATIAPSETNLSPLIRIGGWGADVLAEAAKEVDLIMQGLIKTAVEKYEIEDLSSEKVFSALTGSMKELENKLGIEVLSLAVQSIEPADKKISEAIRQKEAARILEETENTNQKARVSAAQMKLKADEEIMKIEHDLELKKFGLKEIELRKEAVLAEKKLEEELKRNRMRLEIEKEEVSILKDNPELLLLTPQVARLAEASQNLKNARTVVTLGDMENGDQIVNVFKNFLKNILSGQSKETDNKVQ